MGEAKLRVLVFEGIKLMNRDWRDGSGVKSTGCSYRGPRFNSLHPHGGSQPSITPVPGDPMPSSNLQGHQAHMWQTYTYRQNIHTHTKINY